MEIKIANVFVKNKKVNNLNLIFNSNQIIGVYNDYNQIIIDLLTKKDKYTGNILLDNIDIKQYKDKAISYITTNKKYLTTTVSNEFFLIKRKISVIKKEEYLDKITSCLKLVNLDQSYLSREIVSLSKSEKDLLNIALNLISNPDIIIFEESFLNLDKFNCDIIKNIIRDLKRKYQKTIIIVSNNIDMLYELTNQLIIFKNNKLLISDKTDLIFKDLAFLENNNIEIPLLVEFNQIAAKYHKNLKNYKDVKDLIKDVYKNVHENSTKTS